MINHAVVTFGAECAPASFVGLFEGWAFLFAMIAAIVMHFIDTQIMRVTQRWACKQEALRARGEAGGAGPAAAEQRAKEPVTECELVDEPSDEGALPDKGCGDGHGHSHAIELPDYMAPAQRIVAALSLEFGVTLHSVFVGLTLGITADDDMTVLLIALVFHQFFEGIAMGSRLADAPFRLSLELVLALVFALSAPVGIAAGAGAIVASRSALTGSTYVMVSAICDSVCGGILLYLAFVLLVVDFAVDLKRFAGHDMPYRMLKEYGLFAALWVGAGVMALIGKWL
ncbi:solute carrier family 39 (zinc transporter), member 1/2/3 [Strigomonas culicis]|nr:solute carrier family 39 (zinc transporter), member 1/2/3 [Strigomonas culicis]|eukprot:EPY28154.1 solute carrier family 39 (zinc transporter), member 1/2/3 [Strigomonas culicis]